MLRLLSLTCAAEYCALAFVAYKLAEIGPYETVILIGRCAHVFIAAAQGYL